MNLYISTLLADEHRNELMREATAYRAYRLARTARRASSARRRAAADAIVAVSSRPAGVYCSRAAAFNARNGSRPGSARVGGAA
ncbi:MAG: hypothetical protein ACRDV3_18170 [Acidothermaceae bacterium]